MKGKTLELCRFNNLGRTTKPELPKAEVSKSCQPSNLMGGVKGYPSMIMVTRR
jgi:hypothetical protein